MEEMDLKEYLLKEVDLIQDIIKRMAYNSFLLKGWSITLIVVTLLLKGSKHQVWIAFIPLLVFWYLDAYFLRQEMMYRALYDWVRNNRLKTDEYLLDMNAHRFENDVETQLETMRSTTLRWFYGSIAALIMIYLIFLPQY